MQGRFFLSVFITRNHTVHIWTLITFHYIPTDHSTKSELARFCLYTASTLLHFIYFSLTSIAFSTAWMVYKDTAVSRHENGGGGGGGGTTLRPHHLCHRLLPSGSAPRKDRQIIRTNQDKEPGTTVICGVHELTSSSSNHQGWKSLMVVTIVSIIQGLDRLRYTLDIMYTWMKCISNQPRLSKPPTPLPLWSGMRTNKQNPPKEKKILRIVVSSPLPPLPLRPSMIMVQCVPQ